MDHDVAYMLALAGIPDKNAIEAFWLQVIDFRDRFFRTRHAYYEALEKRESETWSKTLDCHFRVPPLNRSQLYQYIDIEDDVVQQILHTATLLSTCSEKTGWLEQASIDAIRERMAVKAELMRRTKEAISAVKGTSSMLAISMGAGSSTHPPQKAANSPTRKNPSIGKQSYNDNSQPGLPQHNQKGQLNKGIAARSKERLKRKQDGDCSQTSQPSKLSKSFPQSRPLG